MFEVHFKVRYIMFICALCLKKKNKKNKFTEYLFTKTEFNGKKSRNYNICMTI